MINPLNITYLNKDALSQKDVKKALVGAVDKIMSHSDDYKGIIHTSNYDQVNLIMSNISKENHRRLLRTEPEKDRDPVIARHAESKEPTVLISPSLYEGIDLHGDLCRFSIIVKVPYANLGDKWINAKKNAPGGQKWYDWVTALHLIQAYGRSIRSETDWAYTFILDSGFKRFVDMKRNILPTWFLEAIQC